MSPLEQDRYDVAIVGYGPVGQMAAILLARRGHRVGVFERQAQLYPLPRAVHYDHEVARIFQAIGISDELAEVVEPIAVYDWQNAAGQTILTLDWRGTGPSGWPVGTMFSQPRLEAILDRTAKAEANVTVHQGWEVVDLKEAEDHVELSLRAGALQGGAWVPSDEQRAAVADYVIGCDGANSMVREAIGTANHDLGFAFDWLIADTIPKDPSLLRGVNLQICDPERPTTIVSGGPGRRRWEWMLTEGEMPQDAQNAEFVWQLLAQSGVQPGDVTLERHAVYTFRARWAEQWRRGRLLLAGDAAHLMPPFAGQGMCSGLRDAHTLAWQLDLVLKGLAADDLLDAYGVERRAHLQHAIMTSVELGKVICVSDPAAAAARDEQMLAALADPALAPPPPPPPCLGPGVLRAADQAAGTLFPQGRVNVDGVRGWFDDVVGRGFVLYALDAKPDDLLPADLRDTLTGLDVRFVEVTEAMDVDGVYRAWFEGNGARAVLVRPDFYVFGAVASLSELGELVEALRARLDAGAPTATTPERT